ncbi:MAG TPA: carboxypeptidase-like regulatory domain-containing protein [Drouetiella sp.]
MSSTVFTYNVSGTVRHQGLTISGVTVSLYELGGLGNPDTLVGKQRTGTRGEFTFGVAPGTYRIEIEPDTNTRFLKTANEINVSGNAILNVGLITGSILKVKLVTKSGALVTTGEVVALAAEPMQYRSYATIGSDNNYALTLPRGKFYIGVRHSRRSLESSAKASHLPFITTEISTVDLQRDASVEVTLPDFNALDGKVTDVFGVPAANVKVRLTPSLDENERLSELGIGMTCLTDANGEFRALVESGTYDFALEPDNGGLLFAAAETDVEITNDIRKEFQLSEGFRLRGQVQYELTQLAQCLVRIQGLDRKIDLMTRTDDNGQFVVGVPGGTYKIVVSAHPKFTPSKAQESAEFKGLAPWTRMVVVGGDTHVPVRLVQGTQLTGRIADETGHTRTGVKVSIYADDEDKELSDADLDVPLATCMTDAEGRYNFFIAPGKYWLAVHTDLSNAQRVEIGTQPKELDVDWHGWCQVKFEVVSDSGQKVPRCRVAYSPYGTAISGDGSSKNLPKGSMLTDHEGICIMTIPAGVYSLRFSPPSDGGFEPKTVKQISISHDLTRTIRLASK